jgi:rhodanese-related sulfurtransferase
MSRIIAMLILSLASLSLAALPATAPATRPAALRKNVDVAQFDKLYETKKYIVLDVRTPEEFGRGHIPGAVNIDVQSPEFEKKMAAMDKDKTYLVHCASGVRSVRACDKLEKMKFTTLYNLEGGFRAWQKAGKPVEK